MYFLKEIDVGFLSLSIKFTQNSSACQALRLWGRKKGDKEEGTLVNCSPQLIVLRNNCSCKTKDHFRKPASRKRELEGSSNPFRDEDT